MAFLSRSQVLALGLRAVGEEVAISDCARFYNAEAIEIGDRARIDDFCILSAGAGGIRIGRHVHIGTYASLIGREAITLEDFSGLSGRVSVYSSSDDYSGEWLTNPTVPAELRNPTHAPVRIGRHAIIGCGAVILPGVTIGEGAAVGALTLVTRDLDPFAIYLGVPARRIGARKRGLLALEARIKG
ncbi:MAG: acyltransferase [Betaproteobacteria bacterium]|nr:acyltransferase [Betaproteobacteria bacterium]MBI2958912.1 acyltransferase [Betaproteobacteria bacterium]